MNKTTINDENPSDPSSSTRAELQKVHMSRVGLVSSSQVLIGTSQRLNVVADDLIKKSRELITIVRKT